MLCKFTATNHFVLRQHERRVPNHAVEFVVVYGTSYRVPDGKAYYLRRRDIPFWMDGDTARKLLDIVAIQSLSGCLVTVYKNQKFLQQQKRRSKWNTAQKAI